MIKNRLRFAGVGIIGSILALVLILAPVPSHAKEKAKDAGSVAVLEKKNAGEIYKENLISTRENSQHIKKSMEKGKEN